MRWLIVVLLLASTLSPTSANATPQDPHDYALGFRRPFGTFYSPSAVNAALVATQGAVKVSSTPYPGTKLYEPADGRTHAAIFLLHGSDGGASGWNHHEAIKWATRGYAVMPYAYFGVPGGPPGLGGVDLDRAVHAMHFLRSSPGVRGKKLAIYGVSRGAEMSVVLASLPETRGLADVVIAHSPQDRTQGSITVRPDGVLTSVRDVDGRQMPAWQYRGVRVPDGTPIGLARFSGSILLTIGTNDEIWSPQGTYALERQLASCGHPDFKVVRYAGEGHALSAHADADATANRLALLRARLGE